MSFNKTTTNALSDEQMAALNAQINSAAAANKPAPVDLTGVMGGLGTLNTGQGTINSGISGVSGDVTGGFSDLNTYLSDQFSKTNDQNFDGFTDTRKLVQQVDGRNQTAFGDLGNQLTGVGGDVTQGFADQTTRFDTLDTSIGDVQTGVNTANTGIDDMGVEMGNRFDTTDKNFTQAGDALTKGFTDTQDDVATLQTEALDGQGNILSDLSTAKTERDAYNVANTGAQDILLGNQDQFKSNFDDYVRRYSDNTTLQNDTLGGIQSGLTGFAGDVNNSLAGLNSAVGTNADAAAAAAKVNSAQAGSVENILQGGFNDLGGSLNSLGGNLNTLSGDLGGVDQNVSGLAGDIAGLSQGQSGIESAISSGFNTSQGSLNTLGNSLGQDFGQLQSNVSNSVDSMGNEQVDYSNQFERVTGQLKSLSQLSGLPDQLRQQFGQLSGSFDKQGNLIQNSIDEQGNTITRAMDNQGNMILRKFDAGGASMGQMAMNLNDVMGQINQLGLVPGGSAGMGNLSQPLQDLGTGNGGFMSPFGKTQ